MTDHTDASECWDRLVLHNDLYCKICSFSFYFACTNVPSELKRTWRKCPVRCLDFRGEIVIVTLSFWVSALILVVLL